MKPNWVLALKPCPTVSREKRKPLFSISAVNKVQVPYRRVEPSRALFQIVGKVNHGGQGDENHRDHGRVKTLIHTQQMNDEQSRRPVHTSIDQEDPRCP